MSVKRTCHNKDMYVHDKYLYVHDKDLYVHDKYLYVHDKDHEFAVRKKDFEK